MSGRRERPDTPPWDDRRILGATLRALREERDIAQDGIRDVRPNYLSLIESGQRSVGWLMLLRILDGMQVSVQEFGALIDAERRRGGHANSSDLGVPRKRVRRPPGS